MCILFKISPLEITLLLTISRALVVVGSVWGSLRPERRWRASFRPGSPRAGWEGPLPATARSLDLWTLVVKSKLYLRKPVSPFFHLLILYYLCHTFPVNGSVNFTVLFGTFWESNVL